MILSEIHEKCHLYLELIYIPMIIEEWKKNDNSSHVPEAVLRHIWSRLFLYAQRLVTTEGKRVQVLHPGFLNKGTVGLVNSGNGIP